ncbi:MAG: tyrosine-type recombinase/integrase [Halorientalis sp.]
MPEREWEIEDPDINQYLDRWETRKPSKKVTINRHREALRKFCIYTKEYLGKDSYKDLTAEDMEDYIYWLINERGLSDLNAQGIFSACRVFLQEQDLEVADDVDLSEFEGETLAQQYLPDGIHWLSVEEHKQMLNACNTLREELICQGLWTTGARRKEFVNIRYEEHINDDEREIFLKTLKDGEDRWVYYSSRFARILREWIDKGGRDSYDYADESPYLIPTDQSEQCQDKYPNDVVRRVADRAGLTTVYAQDSRGRDLKFPTAHTYRHSYIVHRIKGDDDRDGMNLEFLRRLTGHSSVKTLADTYITVRRKEIKKADKRHRPVI